MQPEVAKLILKTPDSVDGGVVSYICLCQILGNEVFEVPQSVMEHNEMESYSELKNFLQKSPKVWLVTGGAGFIGSNIVEALLGLDQTVRCLDNFSTGKRENITAALHAVTAEQRARFSLIEGDIRSIDACKTACDEVHYVLHQAALGSVPRSIDDPILTNENNVTGFLNVLIAARDAKVSRFVYAASSSTYGDHPALPKVEDVIGNPLSPYAVTKYVNELYAKVFSDVYGIKTIGLRYFNVFGPRQDPDGAYAAVVPKWTSSLIRGESVFINGDGETSRDFCYVANAVKANLLAACATDAVSGGSVFNVAAGERMTLNELFYIIRRELAKSLPHVSSAKPIYRDFRKGDVRHSLADISRITHSLGYRAGYSAEQGLVEAMPWYVSDITNS